MPTLTKTGQPPFAEDQSLFSASPNLFLNQAVLTTVHTVQPSAASKKLPGLVLPALYHDAKGAVQVLDHTQPAVLKSYFAGNLSIDRLHKIHKHLWLAGLPRGSRALHAHVLVDRKIYITERADLHLLWQGQKVFLKPLPDYLMCYTIWDRVLCDNRAMYEEANGFLLSYLWLVVDPSDLKVAHDQGLISRQIEWSAWSAFCQNVASNMDLQTLKSISPRYIYGELRLDRINTIYRLCSRTISFTVFMRGYQYAYHNYSSFVERNFAWFVTFTVYIGLVLTAMQVGLGTSELKDNTAFNRVSYGFTVFAIIAPIIVAVLAGVTVLFLILFNLRYALARRQRTSAAYTALLDGETLKICKH